MHFYHWWSWWTSLPFFFMLHDSHWEIVKAFSRKKQTTSTHFFFFFLKVTVVMLFNQKNKTKMIVLLINIHYIYTEKTERRDRSLKNYRICREQTRVSISSTPTQIELHKSTTTSWNTRFNKSQSETNILNTGAVESRYP